jgi:hypothetical protein
VSAHFHLIDLVSQCRALERLLGGSSDDHKIAWLAARGCLTQIPTREEGWKQVFHFQSTLGLEAYFFFSDGLFVFIGDHTTFRPSGNFDL